MKFADLRQPEFQIALALWVESVGISRYAYTQLREVLCLLDNEETQQLPHKLDTLKKNLHNQLPLLPMQRQQVKVTKHIQSTERHDAGDNDSGSWQYWYDLDQLFQTILMSQVANPTIHFGMAEYSDHKQELWNSRAWGSSICSVSGEYALSRNDQILFPGDFVRFPFTPLHKLAMQTQYGRITFVGIDRRSSSATQGKVILTIQPVVLSSTLPSAKPGTDYFVLVEDDPIELEDRCVHTRVDMALDRGSSLPIHTVRVHMVLNITSQQTRSPLKLHSLRGELEVLEYGRQHLESLHAARQRVRSIPLLMFIDDFGIFRNMYRALKAFYMTPAGLPYSQRRKVANNYTLTLGPHGADMAEAVLSFQKAFNDLIMGKWVDIDGEAVVLNVNVLAFTGDMPQQAANTGSLAHQAVVGCRSCYCRKENRGDLYFDVVGNGRYYFDIMLKRQQALQITGQSSQESYLRSFGLRASQSPLQALAPALDLTVTCAYDIPHSEWKGLGQTLQKLLCEGILTSQGLQSYYRAFQAFVPPIQWPRIQSPQHQRSWSLSENGRAILLVPLILRCNATATWFRKPYLEKAQLTLHPFQKPGQPLATWELVIEAYALFAASTSVLSSVAVTSPSKVHCSTLQGRDAFQRLILAASNVATANLTSNSKLANIQLLCCLIKWLRYNGKSWILKQR